MQQTIPVNYDPFPLSPDEAEALASERTRLAKDRLMRHTLAELATIPSFRRLMRQAVNDPGVFTRRRDGEPIGEWQDRALGYALTQEGLR